MLPISFPLAKERRSYAGLHSSHGWRSALEIIVRYEVCAFANDPLFNRMIQHKWEKFGRRYYILRVVIAYALLLACFTSAVVLRCLELKPLAPDSAAAQQTMCSNRTHVDKIKIAFSPDCGSSLAAASIILELILAGPWALWLIITGWRHRNTSLVDLDVNEDRSISASEIQDFVFKNLLFIMDVVSGVVLFFAGVSRIQDWERSELLLLATAGILLFCNAINVLVPFRYIGEIVITVYRMAVGDIFRFLVVYILIWCGFSLAVAISCQHVDFHGVGLDGHEPDSPGNAFLNLIFVSLGDNIGGFIFDLYPLTQAPLFFLMVYFGWVAFASILVSQTSIVGSRFFCH